MSYKNLESKFDKMTKSWISSKVILFCILQFNFYRKKRNKFENKS